MTGSAIQILDLADHPEHAETVFGWYLEQWGDVYDAEALRFTHEELAAAGPPVVLVALEDGRPIGTVSIDPDDVPERRDLAPWLASLYVEPSHRHRGIARSLVDAVLRRARAEGFDALHLMTFDLEDWYLGLGWRSVEPARYHGRDVVFMMHPTN